jgi:hypothetical protein
MYHSSAPAILASTLPAGHLDLRPGQDPMVVCSHCGQWTILTRKIARWHKVRGTQDDCPGGGQRYRLDVAATGTEPVVDTGIRARRSFTKPQPRTPAPLTAIARRNAQASEIASARNADMHAALARLEQAFA